MSRELSREEIQDRIAKRAAQEIDDGALVNLGIGMPTKVANYISEDIEVILQSENGFVGLKIIDQLEEESYPYIVNAGGQPVSIEPGGAFFDSSDSFGIIRGGTVDVTILGALEVAQNGDLANYLIPGKMVPGMGGAMDLVVGAKRVIVAMEHTNKGKPKILKNCTLPLTAPEVVDLIITEMGVFRPLKNGVEVIEIHPDYSLEEVQKVTEAQLIQN